MGNGSILNNPSKGVDTVIVPIVNGEAATAMAHGDVVMHDVAHMITDAAAIAAGTDGSAMQQRVLLATSALVHQVAGVVYDPNGLGIAAGERGTIMIKGYHPAVKVNDAATTITLGTHHLIANDTGKCNGQAYASATGLNVLGLPLLAKVAASGVTSIPVLITCGGKI